MDSFSTSNYYWKRVRRFLIFNFDARIAKFGSKTLVFIINEYEKKKNELRYNRVYNVIYEICDRDYVQSRFRWTVIVDDEPAIRRARVVSKCELFASAFDSWHSGIEISYLTRLFATLHRKIRLKVKIFF